MHAFDLNLLPDNASLAGDGALVLGGCRVDELVARHGTPVFIYDEAHLRARCREAVAAFGKGSVIYATKAFLCKAMARLAFEEGLLLDVASGGELFIALAAGVPGAACIMHGNNKSSEELQSAVEAQVRYIVVDSFDELDRLEALVAAGIGPPPAVLLRITPGVYAHTHEYISTGQNDSKFGFNLANGDARRAVLRAERSPAVKLKGLHCHIGSNVFAADSFAKAAEVMAAFAGPLELPELVLGGGLGVPYVSGEVAPGISAWGAALLQACDQLGVKSRVSVEPGRAIVASAAVTAYTVGTIKHIPGVRSYVAVNGGMSDNPRPVLYGSGYEAILARAPAAARPLPARVVGKHCESGDILLFNAQLPADIAVDDILVTPVTGAYGHSMGSNYNKLRRPPVVFVQDGKDRVVVRRETYEDLLVTDLG